MQTARIIWKNFYELIVEQKYKDKNKFLNTKQANKQKLMDKIPKF